MNMKLLIYFVILLAAVWFLIAPFLGLTGTWLILGFGAALAVTLDYVGVIKVLPFKLKKNISLILMLGLWAYVAFTAGWFQGIVPAALPTGPTGVPIQAVTPSTCMASVSDEIRGTTATLDVNAWDRESNTPYSSAVDLIGMFHIYKNGKSGSDYVGVTDDTSSGTISGYSVGDTVYLYGANGTTTYYADPVEGVCVNTQRFPVSIDAHRVVGETSLSIVVYDDTGSTALTAAAGGGGVDCQDADYTMAAGADSETSIYTKLKVNTANRAFNFGGWAVATFYNITSVEPQSVEATYTKVFTPTHLESVAVTVNTTGSQAITEDYTVYKASSPILMHEWDTIKEQFVVTAHSTNDPDGCLKADPDGTFDGFAILAKDSAGQRGDDGIVYYDLYAHDTGEADVGMDETETSPAGKQSGVLISVT